MIKIKRLDHIQICIPTGKENEAREFYTNITGFEELPKPKIIFLHLTFIKQTKFK